jgi:hypothetical protein
MQQSRLMDPTDREARARALAEQLTAIALVSIGHAKCEDVIEKFAPLILAYEAAIWEQAAQIVESDRWGELGSRYTLRQQLAAAIRERIREA